MEKPATFTETLRDPNTGELLPANEVYDRLRKREEEVKSKTSVTEKKVEGTK